MLGVSGLGTTPWRTEREVRCIRLFALLIATLAVHGPAHKPVHRHKHHTSCRSDSCLARETYHQCSNHDPRACVWHVIYAKRIGEPERAWLLRIPGCESSWKPEEPPNAEGATGLYQFMPETFAGTPEGWGHPERIYSAYWQSFAASWLYEQDGGGREWECK